MPINRLVLDLRSTPGKFADLASAKTFASEIGLPETTAQSFIADKQQLTRITESFDASQYTPKDEDFIRVPFRMLSATIVGADSYKCTDFSNEAVLKASVSKLIGKPAYKDHDCYTIDNVIGVVETAKWTPATSDGNGNLIAAGIDGVFKINAAKNTDIALSLLSDPPEIQSCSVTVDFEWEPSHKIVDPISQEVDERWFRWNVGEIGPDGKMIRRICTNILDYYECSLVFLGADPYAKILGVDGKPINIDRTGIVASMKSDKENGFAQFKEFISGEEKKMYALLDFSATPPTNTSNNIEMSYVKLLAQLSGIPEKDLTEDKAKAHFESIIAEAGKVAKLEADKGILETTVQNLKGEKTQLESEKATLATDKENLTQELSALKPDAEFGKNVLAAKRTECARLYKISAKGKEDANIIKLINESNRETLESLLKQYGGKLTEEFGGSCKSCGSTDISFRSSTEEIELPVKAPKSLSKDAIRDKYDTGSFKHNKKS